MPQSLAQVWLHIVFSTIERRSFLRNPDFREEMFRMLAHHVKETGCISASVGGHIDHVHLLVGLSRTLTIAQLIESIKSETSKWAKKIPHGVETPTFATKRSTIKSFRSKMSFVPCVRNMPSKSTSATFGTERKRPGRWPYGLN